MNHKDKRKRCISCKKSMRKHGKTNQGKVRYRCVNCNITSVKKRKDVTLKKKLKVVNEWILEGRKLHHLAKDYKVSKQTIYAWIEEAIYRYPLRTEAAQLSTNSQLMLDGFWVISNKVVCLIAFDGEHILHAVFARKETYDTWIAFLKLLGGTPLGIVSDGQKGLKKAILERFGDIPHQRCMTHVTRQARAKITRRPRTDAGKELLPLVRDLEVITNHTSRNDWCEKFQKWNQSHESFLKEKSASDTRRPWYTHRSLRAVRSLLRNAMVSLFLFLDYNLDRSTNKLEGGINGSLRAFLDEHRGISNEKKLQVVRIWLNKKKR